MRTKRLILPSRFLCIFVCLYGVSIANAQGCAATLGIDAHAGVYIPQARAIVVSGTPYQEEQCEPGKMSLQGHGKSEKTTTAGIERAEYQYDAHNGQISFSATLNAIGNPPSPLAVGQIAFSLIWRDRVYFSSPKLPKISSKGFYTGQAPSELELKKSEIKVYLQLAMDQTPNCSSNTAPSNDTHFLTNFGVNAIDIQGQVISIRPNYEDTSVSHGRDVKITGKSGTMELNNCILGKGILLSESPVGVKAGAGQTLVTTFNGGMVPLSAFIEFTAHASSIASSMRGKLITINIPSFGACFIRPKSMPELEMKTESGFTYWCN